MKETFMYDFQHTAKFEFSCQELKIRLFLYFARKKNCKTMTQLTQKLRQKDLKIVNTE